jgi:hypothetical protein
MSMLANLVIEASRFEAIARPLDASTVADPKAELVAAKSSRSETAGRRSSAPAIPRLACARPGGARSAAPPGRGNDLSELHINR